MWKGITNGVLVAPVDSVNKNSDGNGYVVEGQFGNYTGVLFESVLVIDYGKVYHVYHKLSEDFMCDMLQAVPTSYSDPYVYIRFVVEKVDNGLQIKFVPELTFNCDFNKVDELLFHSKEKLLQAIEKNMSGPDNNGDEKPKKMSALDALDRVEARQHIE